MTNFIHWTTKEDFDTLMDLDGCVFKQNAPPKPSAQFVVDRIYDMLKPGAYCICWSPSAISNDWALLLEDCQLEIKEQVAMLNQHCAYTMIVGMKPCEKNYAHNALVHGVAGLNINKLRIGDAKVGWNGLGKHGQTWTNKTCGFRNEQEARPVSGRFPCNLILDPVFKEQYSFSTEYFHVLDTSSDEKVFEFCLDMINPPSNNSMIIHPFAQDKVFETICKQRNQSCIIVNNGVAI